MEETLRDLLEERQGEEQKGITFILGDTQEVFISYKELYYAALNLLYELQQQGFKQGDEVVFQVTDNQKFIYSFWACELGGMIPVPVTTGDNDEHKLKLFKIWDILLNPRIIASSDFMERLEKFAIERDMSDKYNQIKERAFCYEEITLSIKEGEKFHQKPEDLAFIQFSSGSTGNPKGVMITHNNFFANVKAAAKWMEMSENDVCLNWMPLTHDMGLIGTHLKSVYLNIHQYNIHTNLFIRRPQLWMKKVSEHKATLLYSPNFGYKYFLKYFREKEDLNWDLSSVRMFYNGAEPISLELCDEFLDKLAPYGLKKNTMHTVYGLAEATIAATFPPLNSDTKKHVLKRNYLNMGEEVVPTDIEDNQAIVFADEGFPIEDCYVKVCSEDGEDIGENRIGYIHIRGGNVTSGYYNDPEENKRVIDKEGWLNTSDLGFMQDGRVVITGRAKDIIFVNGQNYYSHDIERVAEECAGVDMGMAVAIGSFNEQSKRDEIILFLLFKGNVSKFIPSIKLLKDHIYVRMGIRIDSVIPVKKIYKTTSGKVQRYKFRENYSMGEYDKVLQEIEELNIEVWGNREIILPVTASEEKLLLIWQEIFETENISIEDDFFTLGGDSLKITQLISRLQELFETQLEYNQLFMNSTIKSQGLFLDEKKGEEAKAENASMHKYSKADYPLSFAQQRMWFLDYLNSGSPQYNLCKGILLEGKLDVKLLEQSINQIAKRHRILKMSFTEEKGIPVQKFHEDSYIKVDETDVTSMPQCDREKAGLELAEEIAHTPFDLKTAPLIKVHVIKQNKEEYMLILCTHHILFDGWSFGIVIKELMENYKALQKNTAFTAKEAVYQYVDYTNWQSEMLTQDSFKEQVSYWKKQLKPNGNQINLPFDKTRPAVQSYQGETLISNISKEIGEKVKVYAKNTKTTPFMVLLSAFQVLLYRYSLDKEFAIGTSVANRNRKETEDILGFFTNNLVLCTAIKDNYDFDTLVQDTKKTTLLAYENQDVPFDKLVEELNVSRDMSMNPLFQVMFTMQNTKLPEIAFDSIKGTYFSVDAGCARFDLAVDVHESKNEFQFIYEYNTDLFYKETISHMAQNYNEILKNVLENHCIPLDEVEILAEKEKQEVLSSYEKTAKEFGDITGVIQLFEEQVKQNPDKIAARYGETVITYEELNKRASGLSFMLKERGVKKDVIVGLYLERSIELLVAIIGIYKAGGAYLPMDPIFPPSRLLYMIQDAKVEYIITQETMMMTIPDSKAEMIVLDLVQAASDNESFTDFGEKSKKDLAYILYTSGSTGNPKGVQIEQGSLVNFLQSMKDILEIQKQDKWLAVTTVSFDISILELLLPLVSGGTVVIAKREDVFDGKKLLELIREEEITIMQATPATWKLMLDSDFQKNDKLKILCGGEALPKLLADQLVEKGNILFNLYGPTETTIWSTYKTFQRKADKITIGKPIANTSVYVLDQKMMPVPLGVPGELYIGGAGLARGYYNQEKLTEEKFIENPFYGEKDCSERIYKTGDIVKYLNNGELEYLQRMDNQVKIRGFRIELEEIQTILSRHPMVKECVVAAKDTKQKEKIIAAYMILEEGIQKTDIKPEEVRVFLKEKLPEYMIPTAFVVMEEFPLTLNKKVDVKNLPDPLESKIVISKDYEEATNEIEQTLIDIWKEVLGITQVGIKDNFFDLGGYSMLLAQVRSKITEKVEKEIPMIELFKYPTIESLASYLSGKQEFAAASETAKPQKTRSECSQDIAVIGMSGRFPGAKNMEEFWENLCNGTESIARFDKQVALENGASEEEVEKREYVRAWGALGEIDQFDGKFFGYNPKEATVLDPQQRIFLEEVWKAFEYAGYVPENYNGPIGVYASVGMNTYMEQLTNAGYTGSLANDYQVMTSNDKDFLATRVSYKLNLTGPSVTVQTACSSSLVAVHQACQSLKNGECDMAVAGGVSIRMPEKKGYLYQEGMILSKDGHCRAFDETAGGTVGGNGAGAVILKRYEEALADKDEIWAVIKGSAVNNDGSQKIGYTAPSVQGQTKAIQTALKESGINAREISYIETHGTGTSLGDPIEIAALTGAFGEEEKEKQYCAIGSAKTNIGHLDAAAGITGLIKTVLTIKNKKIPPSLHYKNANKDIHFGDSPFYVNTELRDYDKESLFCAGVSSFGIGGTNAHVIVQEAPDKGEGKTSSQQKMYLFPLSAKTAQALYRKGEELKAFLLRKKSISMGDMAYTLSVGRKEFEYRFCFMGDTITQLMEQLDNFLSSHKDAEYKNRLELQTKVIQDISEHALQEIGDLWTKGGKVSWKSLFEEEQNRRIPLPVYPFERTSYWPKPARNTKKEMLTEKENKREPEDFLYGQAWSQSIEDVSIRDGKVTALVLYETEHPFISEFIYRMKESAERIYTCEVGNEFRKTGDFEYEINGSADYDRLLETVLKGVTGEFMILPMFGFDKEQNADSFDFAGDIEKGENSYLSLIEMVKSIGNKGYAEQIQIKVITQGMHKVLNEKKQKIGLNLLIGAVKVIPKEYNRIQCTSIDMEYCEDMAGEVTDAAAQLVDEILSESKETMIAYRGQTRFVQTYKETKLTGKNNALMETDSEDVYVITGGLGGIGLHIAEELLEHGKPALVFLQRQPFIKEEEWDSYIHSQDAEVSLCEKIRKLISLKQKGMNISIWQGDVSEIEDMLAVKKAVLNQYGKVTGIIHAAGSAGGGMIQLKDKESVRNAFCAKVKGTAVLYQVFKGESLKNFLLFSSLNAVTGGFGQSDYSGANAYMDAFAKAFNQKNGTRMISIDWERWPGVGMAKMLSGKENVPEHALLGKQMAKEQGKWVFYRTFQPDCDWALSEHHVFQIPTIAGTTYLEMARAAYEQITKDAEMVIQDVVFLAPLAVSFGQKRDVITILERREEQYEFVIASRNVEEETVWTEHAKGRISPYKADAKTDKSVEDLTELKQKNYQKTLQAADLWGKNESTFIYFGDRWKTMQWFSINEKDALGKITLQEEFLQDLEEFKLHPALLDVATGALRFASGGNYLPFTYQKIVMKQKLESEIYTHFIFHDSLEAKADFITCDITILNSKGEVLVEIKNFAMRLVETEEKLNSKESKGSSKISEQYKRVWSVLEANMQAESNILTEGLTSGEGKQIFTHILKHCHLARIIVSKKEINQAILQADYMTKLASLETGDGGLKEQEMHERPELNNAYADCRNETEERVKAIWQPLLAIEGIGIHDEFFELGGDSLLLIQLHTKLKESFQKDFPVVDLYKYNTIALQAKLMSNELEEDSKAAFEQVGDRVNMQRSKMQQRRNQIQRMRGGKVEP